MRRWRVWSGGWPHYQSVCPACGLLLGWPTLAKAARDEGDRDESVFEEYELGTNGTCGGHEPKPVVESAPSVPPPSSSCREARPVETHAD